MNDKCNEGRKCNNSTTDTGELEDNDGDDPEQPEDDEDGDSDKDMNGSQGGNRQMHLRDGGGEGRGDESDDEAEGHYL